MVDEHVAVKDVQALAEVYGAVLKSYFL
jgi:hypothetical protein